MQRNVVIELASIIIKLNKGLLEKSELSPSDSQALCVDSANLRVLATRIMVYYPSNSLLPRPYTSSSGSSILYYPSFLPSQSPFHGFPSCSGRTHSETPTPPNIVNVPVSSPPAPPGNCPPWIGPNNLPLTFSYPCAGEHCLRKSPRRVTALSRNLSDS